MARRDSRSGAAGGSSPTTSTPLPSGRTENLTLGSEEEHHSNARATASVPTGAVVSVLADYQGKQLAAVSCPRRSDVEVVPSLETQILAIGPDTDDVVRHAVAIQALGELHPAISEVVSG